MTSIAACITPTNGPSEPTSRLSDTRPGECEPMRPPVAPTARLHSPVILTSRSGSRLACERVHRRREHGGL
eukprot:scaffold163136_cov32-Tisochrysis_lutea.AAC.8